MGIGVPGSTVKLSRRFGGVEDENFVDVNFHKIISALQDSRARILSYKKVNWDRKVDFSSSRQSLSLVISSYSCLIRCSDVLEAPIIVIVGIGFRI